MPKRSRSGANPAAGSSPRQAKAIGLLRSFGVTKGPPGYKHLARAPSKAGCFLLGESPSRVKTNQLLVPSVAAVRRRSQDRTKRLKRTQGNTQAVRETAVPEA